MPKYRKAFPFAAGLLAAGACAPTAARAQNAYNILNLFRGALQQGAMGSLVVIAMEIVGGLSSAFGYGQIQKSVVDLLKPLTSQIERACFLQLDGIKVTCDEALFIQYKDGGSAVTFNKVAEDNPVIVFFGDANDAITSVNSVNLRAGNGSARIESFHASGQCVISDTQMGGAACVAHLSDGRIMVGSVFIVGLKP